MWNSDFKWVKGSWDFFCNLACGFLFKTRTYAFRSFWIYYLEQGENYLRRELLYLDSRLVNYYSYRGVLIFLNIWFRTGCKRCRTWYLYFGNSLMENCHVVFVKKGDVNNLPTFCYNFSKNCNFHIVLVSVNFFGNWVWHVSH